MVDSFPSFTNQLDQVTSLEDLQQLLVKIETMAPEEVFFVDPRTERSLFSQLVHKCEQLAGDQPDGWVNTYNMLEKVLNIFTSRFETLSQLTEFLGMRVHSEFVKIGTIGSEYIRVLQEIGEKYNVPLILMNLPVPSSEEKLSIAFCNINPVKGASEMHSFLIQRIPAFLAEMKGERQGNILGIFITNVPLRQIMGARDEVAGTFKSIKDAAVSQGILLEALIVNDSPVVNFTVRALGMMVGNKHLVTIPPSQVHNVLPKRVTLSAHELRERDRRSGTSES